MRAHRTWPLQRRFDKFVPEKPEGKCWPWVGWKSRKGYGRIVVKGVRRTATHVALELDNRPNPGGLIAIHSCDNPVCVNPAHLRWGSVADNAADMMRRVRQNDIRGERNGNSILTAAAVEEIRNTSRAWGSGRVLAQKFGVAETTISSIRNGHNWSYSA